LRFFLLREIHLGDDGDFSERHMVACINNELVANIGNFVHRTLILTQKLSESKIPSAALDDDSRKLLENVTATKERAERFYRTYKLKEAEEAILALGDAFNRYLSAREPWKEKEKAKCNATLYVCSRGITAIAILLEPIMPRTAEKIWAMLNLEKSAMVWENADRELAAPGTPITEPKPLFEKVKF